MKTHTYLQKRKNVCVYYCTYSCITLVNEVKSETFNKLEVAAENVDSYFKYDLIEWGGINYDDYADHTFIESLHILIC